MSFLKGIMSFIKTFERLLSWYTMSRIGNQMENMILCLYQILCKVWQFLKKLNTELPHDPAISLLAIYSWLLKTYVDTKTKTWTSTLH